MTITLTTTIYTVHIVTARTRKSWAFHSSDIITQLQIIIEIINHSNPLHIYEDTYMKKYKSNVLHMQKHNHCLLILTDSTTPGVVHKHVSLENFYKYEL